ncbi:DUF2339 domain-containing protein [Acinetobacter stercoris]|uniref:DUF2339 domain-containing protein n=1 Tax=Acinetobacter stercoris TaxID=2126983 RepID=A0A2U3MYW5_9GAMM|nr:DUF2339 domain-containing protein [Acinetobacter stercoris]SPL70632.1 hypothetical protein KPC_1810 [Acinetobacter stercoris]
MLKGRSEIRVIWLMVLVIIAVGAWFLDESTRILTYVCGLAFVMSVMQYVDQIQKPIQDISSQIKQPFYLASKVPLYISSVIAIVGIAMHWSWMIGFGLTGWIFYFLRWLRRLEAYLNMIEQQIQTGQITTTPEQSLSQDMRSVTSQGQQLGLFEQIKQWIFQGNPVLKIAIIVLVIGVVLLLRFATEHWQLSLAFKLLIVAVMSFAIALIGLVMQSKNRSFALALEGLGLAGLFLTLFFAYYNHVIASLGVASLCFALLMLATLILSLRQQSIELALMAMVVAYLAPFTLPVRDATAIELITYYLLINLAVAVLSTLRPWKILNQIAFLITVVVGGLYAFTHGYVDERHHLALLVLAHTAVFVWLSFRFSQLIAKKDVEEFKLKPALDIALIFGAPIVGFIFIYLMYFKESFWQAGFSLAFALAYAGLYQLAKRNQLVQLISQSYLSLTLIFIALIPPILLPEEWSVIGWAVEGVVIFIFSLHKQSNVSRYLAMGLLISAGIFSFYYLVELPEFPRSMYWVLSLCYVAVVLLANSQESYQKQLSSTTTSFFSILTLSATTMLLVLIRDEVDGTNQFVIPLFILSLSYVLMNEMMLLRKADWSWLIPKWFGVIPVLVFALIVLVDHTQHGILIWNSATERFGFALSGLLLFTVWLRPFQCVHFEKEWVSLGAFCSLSLTSLSLIPGMPYISVVILPLLFCGWCFWQKNQDWNMFWQARTSLALMMIWIICSQLFSAQAFQAYLFPILNPFDLVSIAMLAGFIWMLSLQLKTGLDRGIVAVLIVLSLLWLCSYIVLRALHMYLDTPYNSLQIWQDGTVQLSFTLLWVCLALITMSLASRKSLRSMWILGGSILVLVTLKLVLFDLSHVGTLTRVVSFLGAGFVMLIIAYIAPIPEPEQLAIEDNK